MMQPYTPHGDSNAGPDRCRQRPPGCNLIPLTGTVTGMRFGCECVLQYRCNLIPLTGTVTTSATSAQEKARGCNLIPLTGTVTFFQGVGGLGDGVLMQPYTPHGDSNSIVRIARGQPGIGCNLIPLTGTVTMPYRVPSSVTAPMQPYTPHGDSNFRLFSGRNTAKRMQPYTPHGDSNCGVSAGKEPETKRRCNLIPLTGTVTEPSTMARMLS